MNQSAEPLTLFPEGRHASRRVLPGSEEARAMTAGSGLRLCALCKNYGRLGSLLKILLESSAWGNSLCFLTWKIGYVPEEILETFTLERDEDTQTIYWKRLNRSVTKQSRLLFQLQASVPRTLEKGFSFLPTAKTSDMYNPASTDGTKRGRTLRSVGMWPTVSVCGNYNRKGASKNSGDGLATAVKMWPTPRSADGEKGIRTPEGEARERERRKNGEDLPTAAGGKLNPTWVEWLMNFPEGWTEVDEPE